MNKQIIFNLPVRDLDKSKAFFSALGFSFNPHFSNESAAFMVIVDGSINAMLMTEAFSRASSTSPSCRRRRPTRSSSA
ncbi:VOC family protein [Cystobacter fuscus]